MKKLTILLASVCMCLFFCSSCVNNNSGHLDLSVSDSDDSYQMVAHFAKGKTKKVDEYMNEKIGKNSNMSFVNAKIDGQISLDDHTTFYIQKYPGLLQIKLDKSKNTDQAYHQIKSMCEGIKQLLAGK